MKKAGSLLLMAGIAAAALLNGPVSPKEVNEQDLAVQVTVPPPFVSSYDVAVQVTVPPPFSIKSDLV
ncbi:hypothetical protein [Indiicoccus explosivorum]|uniref:hypothetical protein n=1 Tax=Indiicoccus explosivorum TaxID=1917864 RepID=UPI000B430C74|nr:hypothetical protein [Indiicoccus explosivorum]